MNAMKITAETSVNASKEFGAEKTKCVLFRHQSAQDKSD
jgi:hypothetical protein